MIKKSSRNLCSLSGLILLASTSSAQSAILDVNTLSVDMVSANISIAGLSTGASDTFVPPVDIVMGTYQNPILSFSNTFTGGSFTADIYSSSVSGMAPSASVDTVSGDFSSIDLSSLRLSGTLTEDLTASTYTFDTELWPINTQPTSSTYNHSTGDFSLTWAFSDLVMVDFTGPFAPGTQELSASFDLTISGNATVVPVPAAIWLLSSGLLLLAGVARQRK